MGMQGDLEDVAAAIRSELRLEAEEAEREAAVSAAMRRDMADVARELMAHGDTVAIDVGQRMFVGHIIAVGSDVVTVDTEPRRVDVNLNALQRMRVVERARSGGRRGTSGRAASLRARLLELHLSGEAIEAGIGPFPHLVGVRQQHFGHERDVHHERIVLGPSPGGKVIGLHGHTHSPLDRLESFYRIADQH